MKRNLHPLAWLRILGLNFVPTEHGFLLSGLEKLSLERQSKALEFVRKNKEALIDGWRRGIRDGLPCEGFTPDDPAIGGYSDMGKLLEAIERAIVRGLWICPELKKWVYRRECPDLRVCGSCKAALEKAA